MKYRTCLAFAESLTHSLLPLSSVPYLEVCILRDGTVALTILILDKMGPLYWLEMLPERFHRDERPCLKKREVSTAKRVLKALLRTWQIKLNELPVTFCYFGDPLVNYRMDFIGVNAEISEKAKGGKKLFCRFALDTGLRHVGELGRGVGWRGGVASSLVSREENIGVCSPTKG